MLEVAHFRSEQTIAAQDTRRRCTKLSIIENFRRMEELCIGSVLFSRTISSC
jgi:hypothetical protein